MPANPATLEVRVYGNHRKLRNVFITRIKLFQQCNLARFSPGCLICEGSGGEFANCGPVCGLFGMKQHVSNLVPSIDTGFRDGTLKHSP